MCPNPLPPPVFVEPEPEPPLTPVIITPVTLEETSNDYVFFILLCMVLSLVICGFCAGMLYKKNKKQENKVIPTDEEDIET